MKPNILYTATLATIAILSTACERELDFKSDENNPENIALSVIANPDTTLEVMAGRTYLFSRVKGDYNALEVFDKASSLRFGHVYYSVNGGETKEMAYDDANYRFRCDYRPKVGDRIEVTASAADLPTVSGATIVPSKPKIEVVEVDITKRPFDPVSSYMSYQYKADIKLRITDPAESGNYYRLVVKNYDRTYEDVIDMKEFRNTFTYNDIYHSDDEIFKDTDLYAAHGKWERNFSDVFSDQLFNGATREFTVSTYLAPSDLRFARIVVDLQSITREMYFYLKSLMVYSITPQDEYTEAIQIYSNVKDGWGIVGAVNVDHHVINP